MAFLKSLIYCTVLGIAAYFLGESLPRRWFRADRFPFRPWKWEKEGTVYRRIHVQHWKDHVPDMSRIMKNMVPKRLGVCPTSRQVHILVQETCVAETVHLVLCLFAPPIWFFWHNFIGTALMIAYIGGNLCFVIIQRYNRPALISLAQRLEHREERKKNENAAHSDPVG